MTSNIGYIMAYHASIIANYMKTRPLLSNSALGVQATVQMWVPNNNYAWKNQCLYVLDNE